MTCTKFNVIYPNLTCIADPQCFNSILEPSSEINIVFHISEDGSEIELKHCASSKTSVKLSQKYFVHLNWIKLATNPS